MPATSASSSRRYWRLPNWHPYASTICGIRARLCCPPKVSMPARSWKRSGTPRSVWRSTPTATSSLCYNEVQQTSWILCSVRPRTLWWLLLSRSEFTLEKDFARVAVVNPKGSSANRKKALLFENIMGAVYRCCRAINGADNGVRPGAGFGFANDQQPHPVLQGASTLWWYR